MKIYRLAGVIALGLISSGCASVVEGTSQTIAVNTTPAGASCTLNRQPEGVIGQIPNTPGSALIKKTKYDITIKCNKAGYQEATATDKSGSAGAGPTPFQAEKYFTTFASSTAGSMSPTTITTASTTRLT